MDVRVADPSVASRLGRGGDVRRVLAVVDEGNEAVDEAVGVDEVQEVFVVGPHLPGGVLDASKPLAVGRCEFELVNADTGRCAVA